METYILFYSNYCANCKEFIQSLYKSPFFEKFKKVCVDNNTNVPKEITSIPAIIDPYTYCFTVLRIWIRTDTELLPGSGIFVPDPAKDERADCISQFSPVISGLCVLYSVQCTVKDCSMK